MCASQGSIAPLPVSETAPRWLVYIYMRHKAICARRAAPQECEISAAHRDASLHVIAASRHGEQHIPVILSQENSNLFLQRGICPSTSN